MTKKEQKNEGPTCACGKAELYEEFLKNQKEEKDEAADSATPKKTNKAKQLPLIEQQFKSIHYKNMKLWLAKK